MLIIVEGPDLAGKSTFIEGCLKPVLGGSVTVINKGPARLPAMQEYEEPLLRYRPGNDAHVICGRWHWGERVYPDIIGRPARMDDVDFYHIELFLRSRGAFLVHFTANTYTLRCRYAERGDRYVKCDQLDAIHDSFIKVDRYSMLPRITIDTSHLKLNDYDSWQLVLDEVLQSSLTEATHAGAVRDFTTYVGVSRPKLLLLGDRRGVRGADAIDLRPGFQTHNTSSGRWLLRALLRYYPYPGDIGFANACDVDDPVKLWNALGCPPAIALGEAAWHVTKSFVRGRVKHPQYFRRFKHHDMAEYVSNIIEAAH